MSDRNNEEICQIFSIINYKIILYSLLIQSTMGVAQTFRKITGCIHAVAAILNANDVSLLPGCSLVCAVFAVEGVSIPVHHR